MGSRSLRPVIGPFCSSFSVLFSVLLLAVYPWTIMTPCSGHILSAPNTDEASSGHDNIQEVVKFHYKKPSSSPPHVVLVFGPSISISWSPKQARPRCRCSKNKGRHVGCLQPSVPPATHVLQAGRQVEECERGRGVLAIPLS
ncbi:hypothetical protein BJ166DRAFT_331275 [Pestalotiopsis sp. NC0098]|nr:hypothetical protein BJ166DRAFT_331275 [Pestalotiopsis sp. NC0098]